MHNTVKSSGDAAYGARFAAAIRAAEEVLAPFVELRKLLGDAREQLRYVASVVPRLYRTLSTAKSPSHDHATSPHRLDALLAEAIQCLDGVGRRITALRALYARLPPPAARSKEDERACEALLGELRPLAETVLMTSKRMEGRARSWVRTVTPNNSILTMLLALMTLGFSIWAEESVRNHACIETRDGLEADCVELRNELEALIVAVRKEQADPPAGNPYKEVLAELTAALEEEKYNRQMRERAVQAAAASAAYGWIFHGPHAALAASFPCRLLAAVAACGATALAAGACAAGSIAAIVQSTKTGYRENAATGLGAGALAAAGFAACGWFELWNPASSAAAAVSSALAAATGVFPAALAVLAYRPTAAFDALTRRVDGVTEATRHVVRHKEAAAREAAQEAKTGHGSLSSPKGRLSSPKGSPNSSCALM